MSYIVSFVFHTCCYLNGAPPLTVCATPGAFHSCYFPFPSHCLCGVLSFRRTRTTLWLHRAAQHPHKLMGKIANCFHHWTKALLVLLSQTRPIEGNHVGKAIGQLLTLDDGM